MVEVVGLGIERHFRHTVKGSKERRKLRGLVDEAVGGRRFQNCYGMVTLFKPERFFWKPLMSVKTDYFTEDNQGNEAFYRGSILTLVAFVFFCKNMLGSDAEQLAFIRGFSLHGVG
jgi:hypothetical protein